MTDRLSENDSDDDTSTLGPHNDVPGGWPNGDQPYYSTQHPNGQTQGSNGQNNLGLAFLSQPNINAPLGNRDPRNWGVSASHLHHPDPLVSTHPMSSEPPTPREASAYHHALQRVDRRNISSNSLVRAALTPASGTMTPEDPTLAGPGPSSVAYSTRRLRRRGEDGAEGSGSAHSSRPNSSSAPPPAERAQAQQQAHSLAQTRPLVQFRTPQSASSTAINVTDDRDLDRELEQSVQAALGGNSTPGDPEVARGRARSQRSVFRSRAEQYASAIFGRAGQSNGGGGASSAGTGT